MVDPEGVTEIEIELDDETHAILKDLVAKAHARGDLDATESSVLHEIVIGFLSTRSDVEYQVEVTELKPSQRDLTLADEYARASSLLDPTLIESEPT